MFKKIDKQLKILKNNKEGMNTRLKSYKRARKQLKKIESNINDLGIKIKDHCNSNAKRTINKTTNINNISELLEQLQNDQRTIELKDLNTSVDIYCKSMDDINGIINYLENEKTTIKNVKRKNNKIKVIDISKILLNDDTNDKITSDCESEDDNDDYVSNNLDMKMASKPIFSKKSSIPTF